jgi:ferrous iron transport protein B
MSSCHAPAPAGPATGVLLVGNPNTGKSTLFNALTGARQRVTNAPGTTVELQTGTWRTGAGEVAVVDLPGTYSLIARSPDEAVVATALEDPAATAVVVLDATALSRSLYLLAQVARSGRPVVAVITMLDVAASHGLAVDATHLQETLGVPVVALDPRTRQHLDRLELALADAAPVRGLTAGTDGPDLPDQLAGAELLFAWVERITATAVSAPTVHRTRTDRVDRVLLNPWVGVPVFLAAMWTLFQLATSAAVPVMDLVDRAINAPLASAAHAVLGSWAGPLLEGLVVDGVLAGIGVVLTFVPLMAIMYAALALLEDSGYMARAAFLADRVMRTLGLDGRAMLPLIIGFGCNVPALAATRTIPNARQRLLTGLLIPWTSCAARLAVYVLLAGVFFPAHAGTAIFAMYLISVLLVVGGGLVLRRTLFRDVRREPLVLVLPAYQRPRLRAIALSVGTRVWAFVHQAGRIIVATLVVMWVLMAVPSTGGHRVGDVPVKDSLYGVTASAVAPVFAPAGLDDWHLTAALAAGVVAKEVVVASLVQSYGVEDVSADAVAAGGHAGRLGDQMRATFVETSGGHPTAAALAFMVFVLGYTPCVATVAEQARRFGARWALGGVGVQMLTAWVLAVVVFQVGRLL